MKIIPATPKKKIGGCFWRGKFSGGVKTPFIEKKTHPGVSAQVPITLKLRSLKAVGTNFTSQMCTLGDLRVVKIAPTTRI